MRLIFSHILFLFCSISYSQTYQLRTIAIGSPSDSLYLKFDVSGSSTDTLYRLIEGIYVFAATPKIKTLFPLQQVSGLQASLDAKQNSLVSATNIKTINGSSVLGSGDLVVTGGAVVWDDVTDKPTTTSWLSNSANKNFVTDAQATVIGNTSGTNSGNDAANTTYANDYRAANFIAGTNYLAPNGNGSALTGLTSAQVSLGNADNTSDANKPVSVATQTALNLKANIASPTFTGTVGGITSSMVGLGNVTNESKATMFTSPTFTGTTSGITATMVGLGNVTNESKATMFTNSTFTGTHVIPATTGTSLTATGIIASSGTAGIGYTTGAGGTVTQATSKTTGVTLNKTSGQITMNGAALAAAAEVSFTVTNSTVASTDVIIVNVQSVGTAGAYFVTVGAVANGSFSITVGNASAGSLSQALVLNFAVIKSVIN